MTDTTVKAGTVARTVCLFLALVNQILSATGHAVLPIEDSLVEAFITAGFTIAAALWAWWKNNSFTAPAIKADNYLKEMKEGKK